MVGTRSFAKRPLSLTPILFFAKCPRVIDRTSLKGLLRTDERMARGPRRGGGRLSSALGCRRRGGRPCPRQTAQSGLLHASSRLRARTCCARPPDKPDRLPLVGGSFAGAGRRLNRLALAPRW